MSKRNKTILVVEQGRMNWKNEYIPLSYCPVDSMDSAKYFLENALKEYEDDPMCVVDRINENLYQITFNYKMQGVDADVQFLSIREMALMNKKDIKESIKAIAEEKNKEKTELPENPWSFYDIKEG